MERVIQPTAIQGFDVAPATIELAGAEIELVSIMSRVSPQKALDTIADQYDYI